MFVMKVFLRKLSDLQPITKYLETFYYLAYFPFSISETFNPDPLGFTIAVIFSISKAFYAVKIDIPRNGEVTNSYI